MSSLIKSIKKTSKAAIQALTGSKDFIKEFPPTILELETAILVDKMPMPYSVTNISMLPANYRIAWLIMMRDLMRILAKEPYGADVPKDMTQVPDFLWSDTRVDKVRIYSIVKGTLGRLAAQNAKEILGAKDADKEWAASFDSIVDSQSQSSSVTKKKSDEEEEIEEKQDVVPPKQPASAIMKPELMQASITVVNRFSAAAIETFTVDQLIDLLSLGLRYDGLDTDSLRIKWFKTVKPSFNEVLAIVTAYVYIGNKPSNLNTKVIDSGVGKEVLGIINKFGIVAKKIDGVTLTLSRVAIAMAPFTYFVRQQLHARGRLPSSGVSSTTPPALQDVALSGIRKQIPGGDSIDDFLIKFNRALTVAREKNEKTKSTEAEMDAVAKKFMDLSMSGAQRDKKIFDFAYATPTHKELTDFYESVVETARLAL
jgi:hypothetical protein